MPPYLYAINFLSWFSPYFFLKGFYRTYGLSLSLIFSSSYWFYLIACDILSIEYPSILLKEHIETSLIYSSLGGLFFNFGFLIFKSNAKTFIKKPIINFFEVIRRLPGRKYSNLIKFISFILTVYIYIHSTQFIGSSGRVEWRESNAGALHQHLLVINALLIFYSILNDYEKSRFSNILTLTLATAHVFADGFDGSRRAALIAISAYLFIFIINKIQRMDVKNTNLYIFLILALFSSYLSLSRPFVVGWAILLSEQTFSLDLVKSLFISIAAPTPTVHVNTHMIEYIKIYGEQGFENYFSAIINTIFPRFIFGDYYGGTPLTLRLHEQLGWYGWDFGFLAESIYSGGWIGVALMHLLLGTFATKIAKNAQKGSVFAIVIAAGFMIGLLNGVRADFMNLLKITFYTSILLYGIIYFLRKNSTKTFKA